MPSIDYRYHALDYMYKASIDLIKKLFYYHPKQNPLYRSPLNRLEEKNYNCDYSLHINAKDCV